MSGAKRLSELLGGVRVESYSAERSVEPSTTSSTQSMAPLISEQLFAAQSKPLRRRMRALERVAQQKAKAQQRKEELFFICETCLVVCEARQHAAPCTAARVAATSEASVAKMLVQLVAERSIDSASLFLVELFERVGAADDVLSLAVRAAVVAMCARAVESAHPGWSIPLTAAENRLFDLEKPLAPLIGTSVSAITQLLASTLSSPSSSASASSSSSTTTASTTTTTPSSSSSSTTSPSSSSLDLVKSVLDAKPSPDWLSPNLFVSLVRRVVDSAAAADLLVAAVESDQRVARAVALAINTALGGLQRTIVGGAGVIWRSLSDAFVSLCRRSRSFRAALHATLRTEAGMAHKGWSGRDFEESSVLGAQLSHTSMARTGSVSYFRLLAKRVEENVALGGNGAAEAVAIRALTDALREAVSAQQCRVYDVLLALLSDGELDDAVVWDWCAAVFEVNEIRVSSQQSRDHMSADMQQFSSSEEFLCNLGAVVLRFCEPHVRFLLSSSGGGGGVVGDALRALEDNYASVGSRFGLAHFAPLRSATDSTAPLFPDDAAAAVPPPTAARDAKLTERFFAASRALHVCIVPALLRSEQYKLRLRQLSADLEDPAVPFVTKEILRANAAYVTELELAHRVVVGASSFLTPTLTLAAATLLWLADRRSPQLFGALPACTVTDACRALLHVLRCARDLLGAHPGALSFVRAATALLASPSLVAHPPTRATLSDLLLALLTARELTAQVFESDALVRERLVRALADAYVAVGIVEGLDVDKQAFDKYSARQVIAEALLEALGFAPHLAQLRAWCAAPPPNAPLEALIDTMLNDVLHLVDDALQRIVNVRQLELAEQDASWALQSSETIRQRRRYADGESMVARGFLGMAMSMLALLARLAREAPAAFAQPRVLPKTTSMLLRFMAQLCVPARVAQLAVKQPERCGFDADKLMELVLGVAAPLGKLEQFVAAFQRDYAFEPEIMQHALAYVLVKGGGGAKLAGIQALAIVSSATTTTAAAESTSTLELAAPPPTAEQLAQLETRYLATLAERRFDAYAMRRGTAAYAHHFATRIADTAPGAARLARIMQECESLTGDTLPLTLQSGVFVRVDEERIDVMKALIIGAEGTPYSGGAFEFDVFLPGDYPIVPPLVNLETTGNGTVRFNPNLYNCGKVCLSILGTWHGGGDSASKWNASHSTIQQVLVSIQGLILIEKPFFNEPAYEVAAGTREGEQASHNYNEQLRLATARHAILDPLRRINGAGAGADPEHAFDASVLKPHFALQRPRLLAQLARWRDEASDANRTKFASVLREIVAELDKLKE